MAAKLKNSFLMAQVWRHLVPIMFAFFWGTTDKLRFSALCCLSTMKGSEGSAAPVPLPLNSPASALLSPMVYTHQYGSQPSPKLSYLAHKPYFRVDKAGAGTTWSQKLPSSLPPEVTDLWQAPRSSYRQAQNRSALGKVTGHSSPKSKLDGYIQALSCPQSKW